jgi:rhodanese-related sulfurtransferase
MNKINRRRFGLTFIVTLAFAAIAFFMTPTFEAASDHLVTPEKAKQLIDSGKIDLILDVRTPQEYSGSLGNIKGSRLIPVQSLRQRIGEIGEYKDKTVLVYCHSGMRSDKSSKILASAGFTKILDLQGGIVNWRGKGY